MCIPEGKARWSPEGPGEVGQASLDREVIGFNRTIAETAASIFASIAMQRFGVMDGALANDM